MGEGSAPRATPVRRLARGLLIEYSIAIAVLALLMVAACIAFG